MRLILCIAVLLVVAGCHPAKQATDTSFAYPSSVPLSDSISFLVFRIKKSSSSTISDIRLVSKKTTPGKLKLLPASPDVPDNLEFIYLKDKQALLSQRIQHPLYGTVEYPGDPGSGELASSKLNLDSTEFFIRVQLPAGTNNIIIRETINKTTANKRTLINL